MFEYNGCLESGPGERAEFSNRSAGAGDGQMLASSDPVDDLTTVIAKVANTDLGIAHEGNVSHVRRNCEGWRCREDQVGTVDCASRVSSYVLARRAGP